MGSHYAYIAIMAAVCMRDLTGDGQYIDASVHSSCALTTEGAMPIYMFTKQVVRRNTGRHHSVGPSPRSQYATSDGRYINFGALRLTADRLNTWADWMDLHGVEHDLDDPKYMEPGAIQQYQEHINGLVERFFASVPAEVAYHEGQERGFLLGAVRSPEDTIEDQHWHDREMFVDVEHPELGMSFTYPGGSSIYPKSPWSISRRAPLVGEHNEEVLCSELGLSRDDLVVLTEAGVV